MIGVDDLLISLGLGVLGELSGGAIEAGVRRVRVGGKMDTKGLLIKSFHKAMRKHAQYYDESAKAGLKRLKKEMGRTPELLVEAFEELGCKELPVFLHSVESGDFQKTAAKRIVRRYFPDTENPTRDLGLTEGLVVDVLGFYREEFLRAMSSEQYLVQIFKGVIGIHDIVEAIRTEIATKDKDEGIRMQLERIFDLLTKEAEELEPHIIDHDRLLRRCRNQVRTSLQPLKGTEVDASTKYIPGLFAERRQVTREFREFLRYCETFARESKKAKTRSKSRLRFDELKKLYCIVFIGEAGIGKTTHLCDLAERFSKRLPLLFYNGFSIRKDFREVLKHEMNQLMGTEKSLDDALRSLNDMLTDSQSKLLVFVDAINESPNYAELKFDLTEIFRGLEKLEIDRIFFCLSCRDMDWKFFSEENPHFVSQIFSSSAIEDHSSRRLKEMTKEIKRMYRERSSQRLETDMERRMKNEQRMKNEIESLERRAKRNVHAFFIENHDPDTLQPSDGFMLDPFKGVELERIWRVYKKHFQLRSKAFHSLNQSVKEMIRNPLMLRFLAEGFKSTRIPEDVRRIEIFNRYWDRKFDEIGRLGLRFGNDKLKQQAIDFILSLSRKMRERRMAELPESDVERFSGLSPQKYDSAFFRVLSEYIIIYARLDEDLNDSVVGFTYEAFFEFVIAKDIYAQWAEKGNEVILGEFENLIVESLEFRNVRGAIMYIVLFLENAHNDVYKEILLRYASHHESDVDFVFEILLRLKYVDSDIMKCLGETIKRGPYHPDHHKITNLSVLASKVHHVFVKGVFDELEAWTKWDSIQVLRYLPIILLRFRHLDESRALDLVDVLLSQDQFHEIRVELFKAFERIKLKTDRAFRVLNKFMNDSSRRLRLRAMTYLRSMDLTSSRDVKILLRIDDSQLVRPTDFKIEVLKESKLGSRSRNRLLESLLLSVPTRRQLNDIMTCMNTHIDKRRQKAIWERLISSHPTNSHAYMRVIEGVSLSNLTEEAKRKLLEKARLNDDVTVKRFAQEQIEKVERMT